MTGGCSSSVVGREVLILHGSEVQLAAVLPEMSWYFRETKEVLRGRGVSLQDYLRPIIERAPGISLPLPRTRTQPGAGHPGAQRESHLNHADLHGSSREAAPCLYASLRILTSLRCLV
jgi:hypothetical protein